MTDRPALIDALREVYDPCCADRGISIIDMEENADKFDEDAATQVPTQPEDGELVVRKPRYDAFLRTSLEDDLRTRGIDTLAIAGVITNCCVDTSARSAFMRGFDVLVLEDCVGTFAEERDLHASALRNLSLLFAVVGDSTWLQRVVAA